jgi:hypothetical protein
MSPETEPRQPDLSASQPLIYREFNLRFSGYEPGNGTFQVWVEGESPGGAMKPEHAIGRTLDLKAFWDEPEYHRGGLLGDLERRELDEKGLAQLGAMLSDLALPEGAVRTLFASSLARQRAVGEGLRVRLRLDPTELAQLPWEFLALPEASGPGGAPDFLALWPDVSLTRTDTVEAGAPELPGRRELRVVAALSGPRDQRDLDLGRDKEAIEKAVQALNQAAGEDLVSLAWAGRVAGGNPATQEEVEKALAGGADLFHFAGHGIFDPLTNEGQIILETPDRKSDYYPAASLASLLQGTGVRLAVLGACETGRRDGRNPWTGVAPALTRGRIPAVIANQFKIADENAILLASRIYPRIVAGFTVDEAASEARRAIFRHKGLKYRDWGVPVLYLQSADGVLFPAPASTAPELSQSLPFLHVANAFKSVSGEVVDLRLKEVTGGRIVVQNKVEEVKKGGSYTTVDIGYFGPPRQ